MLVFLEFPEVRAREKSAVLLQGRFLSSSPRSCAPAAEAVQPAMRVVAMAVASCSLGSAGGLPGFLERGDEGIDGGQAAAVAQESSDAVE